MEKFKLIQYTVLTNSFWCFPFPSFFFYSLICYEFVSVSTLEDFLCKKGTVLNFDTVCAIAYDVISAIERLQDLGILHNNITTSNILIGQCPRVSKPIRFFMFWVFFHSMFSFRHYTFLLGLPKGRAQGLKCPSVFFLPSVTNRCLGPKTHACLFIVSEHAWLKSTHKRTWLKNGGFLSSVVIERKYEYDFFSAKARYKCIHRAKTTVWG